MDPADPAEADPAAPPLLRQDLARPGHVARGRRAPWPPPQKEWKERREEQENGSTSEGAASGVI